MKLSSRTDYALRALFTLVEADGKQLVSTRQLAERNDIPKKFLEQILMEMKQKGWIESVTGKHGGYRLGKPPGQITMGEVIRHFDGILAPIACVSATGYKPCTQETVCRFRRRRSMPPAARPARAMAIVEGSGTGTIRVLSKPP